MSSSVFITFIIAFLYRNPDSKGTPLSNRTLNPNGPAVSLHDPIGNRQAKAGTLAYVLGGEEGLEEFIEILGRYTTARVRDADLNTPFTCIARRYADSGGYRDTAAPFRCIEGIQNDIQYHALKLATVEDNGRQVFAWIE